MSKLVQYAAATDRPVRSDEAAEWLRETDLTRLQLISDLIDSAIATLELEHWTQFCTATYDEYFDDWPACRFMLRKNPVITVSSVKYTDSSGVAQTVASTVWEQAVESGRGIVRLKYDQSWPSGNRGHDDDIVIRYTAGYGLPAAVPAPIKHAIRLWLADSYDYCGSMVPLTLNNAPKTVESLMAAYSYRTVG